MKIQGVRVAALAAAVVAGLSAAQSVHAAAINVLLSRTLAGDTAGNTNGNNGINPVTYTPALTTIGAAPSVSYDAADTADSGTQWNTLLVPATPVDNTAAGAVTITTVYQQNIPLANSSGTASPATLDVSFTEPGGKNDTIHSTGVVAASSPGTDGSVPTPSALVNQSWVNNSTSEIITFTLHGLTAGNAYSLYVYGAGQNYGYGGTYTVPVANQGSGYLAATGAYTTEPILANVYRSVFDPSNGYDPAPEKGLSWVALPVIADTNGNLSFNVNKDSGSGIKGSINGFQLDAATTSTPEPASLGLLAIGGLALISRRRKA